MQSNRYSFCSEGLCCLLLFRVETCNLEFNYLWFWHHHHHRLWDHYPYIQPQFVANERPNDRPTYEPPIVGALGQSLKCLSLCVDPIEARHILIIYWMITTISTSFAYQQKRTKVIIASSSPLQPSIIHQMSIILAQQPMHKHPHASGSVVDELVLSSPPRPYY